MNHYRLGVPTLNPEAPYFYTKPERWERCGRGWPLMTL